MIQIGVDAHFVAMYRYATGKHCREVLDRSRILKLSFEKIAQQRKYISTTAALELCEGMIYELRTSHIYEPITKRMWAARTLLFPSIIGWSGARREVYYYKWTRVRVDSLAHPRTGGRPTSMLKSFSLAPFQTTSPPPRFAFLGHTPPAPTYHTPPTPPATPMLSQLQAARISGVKTPMVGSTPLMSSMTRTTPRQAYRSSTQVKAASPIEIASCSDPQGSGEKPARFKKPKVARITTTSQAVAVGGLGAALVFLWGGHDVVPALDILKPAILSYICYRLVATSAIISAPRARGAGRVVKSLSHVCRPFG
eukprot:gene15716-21828_t